MKYEVKYSCGHEGIVNLVGKTDSRERRIAYLEAYGLCSDCYKAEKEAKKANGCKEVQMLYREYKNKWPDLATKADSYDSKTKTIIVYMPEELEEINLDELEILAEIDIPQHNSYCEFDDVKAYMTEISGKLTIIFQRLDRTLYVKQAPKVGRDYLHGKTQEQLVEVAVNVIKSANSVFYTEGKDSPFVPNLRKV